MFDKIKHLVNFSDEKIKLYPWNQAPDNEGKKNTKNVRLRDCIDAIYKMVFVIQNGALFLRRMFQDTLHL